eukprot:968724-Karenia_brevis.AAC.1
MRLVFVPKKASGESHLVTCDADALRPIGCKNTDSKWLSSVECRSVHPAMQSFTVPCQRGCTRGRDFLENVVELDSHSRA